MTEAVPPGFCISEQDFELLSSLAVIENVTVDEMARLIMSEGIRTRISQAEPR